jgi:hypothetical protein
MGADAFIVYFGIRYTVESEDELDRLERRDDPRLVAARKARLKTYFGRATEGEDHCLLVGSELGQFGVEAKMEAELTEEELQRVAAETAEKLVQAGLEGRPKRYLQVVAQY